MHYLLRVDSLRDSCDSDLDGKVACSHDTDL